MTNPFIDPSPSLTFTCSFCGKEQPVEAGKVIVCDCEGARQQQVMERQRMENWRREQEAQTPRRDRRKKE